MIDYEPKHWFAVLCSVRCTVLPRIIWRICFFTLLTGGLWAWDRLVAPLPMLDPLGHSLLGVALGMLIVLRTNTSYDRWWEGRKLWGSLVNSCRNLIRAAAVNGGDIKELIDLVGAYAIALKLHLRVQRDVSVLKDRLPADVYERTANAANPPAVLAFFISRWIKERQAAGQLDSAIARQFDARVNDMTELQGNCERILHSPIPLAYAAHIKQLLMLYLLSLPLLLVPKMGVMTLFVIPAITFGLLGVEEAGVEIEDPFGDDPNDLPLDELCAVIACDAAEFAALGALPEEPERQAA